MTYEEIACLITEINFERNVRYAESGTTAAAFLDRPYERLVQNEIEELQAEAREIESH